MKKKNKLMPDLPKEYVWELEVDGEDKIYKVVVDEDMCTTYLGDQEHKHLKVMDKTCKVGVLQIDTVTSIYGQMIPFQLERYIPYIQLEGKWKMSDTTRQDRIEEGVSIHRRNSLIESVVGALFLLAALIAFLVGGKDSDWWMFFVFGVFVIFSAITRMVRLRNELMAIREAEEEAAAQEAAEKEAAENEVPALEAPESEE